MKNGIFFFVFFLGLALIPFSTYAQEEEIETEKSAEVFLEEYSDDFQENFFEALKQKGIENYDRSINVLLECKRLDAANRVVDHELAKVYLVDKQFVLAQEHAVVALVSEPENVWYLDTLVEIMQQQGSSIDAVKSGIPYENDTLKENLALIQFKRENYESALGILKAMNPSRFKEDLSLRINDSIDKQKKTTGGKISYSATNIESSDPLQQFKNRIRRLIVANNHTQLQQVSEEALESYPSQPYFYYAQGYALNKRGKHRDAVEVLESAFDYMLGDIALNNKIYQELADAHIGLHNTIKANMYLRKIKPGF